MYFSRATIPNFSYMAYRSIIRGYPVIREIGLRRGWEKILREISHQSGLPTYYVLDHLPVRCAMLTKVTLKEVVEVLADFREVIIMEDLGTVSMIYDIFNPQLNHKLPTLIASVL